MKKIGIFYFVIVILCSILPCSDALEAKAVIGNTIQNISHNKQDCNAENCTSICLCTCCGQSIVMQTQIAFEIKIATVALRKQDFLTNFSPQHNAKNIWQPPKIAA